MWLFGCFILYALGSFLILDGGCECTLVPAMYLGGEGKDLMVVCW